MRIAVRTAPYELRTNNVETVENFPVGTGFASTVTVELQAYCEEERKDT